MTPAQVVAALGLLARLYGVNPAAAQCMIYHESRFDPAATNGVHAGLAQFKPGTWDWMIGLALDDPKFLHAHLFRDNPSPFEPIPALALFTWALRNGYEEHWNTYWLCWEIQPLVMR